MKVSVALALGLTIGALAFAGNNEVKIPKQGWTISFDSPPLKDKHDSREGGQYAFMADSGPFTISLYVEEPHGTGDSHKACYEYYWSRASRSPILQKDTVSMSEAEKFVRVQYDTVGALVPGHTVRSKNVNYYFVYRGKWVDVHISILVAEDDGESLIAAFDKSLTYGP